MIFVILFVGIGTYIILKKLKTTCLPFIYLFDQNLNLNIEIKLFYFC